MRGPSRNIATSNHCGEEEDDDFDPHQSHAAVQVEVNRLVSQLMKRTILVRYLHGCLLGCCGNAIIVRPITMIE